MSIKKKTKIWHKLHLYLSLFFLPAALLYAITGALYIFGVREDALSTRTEYKLEKPPESGAEREFMLAEMKKLDIKIPSDTTLRNVRNVKVMGNKRYEVSLREKEKSEFVLQSMERSIYGILVLMHKAKDTFWFNFMAVAFSIAMLIFYISGLLMTKFCKNNRTSLIAIGVGFVITILCIVLSI